MVHSIGTIPGIIVIIKIIGIVNDGCIAMIAMISITAIIMVTTINANSHHCKRSKIRRIISVIIGWIIRYVSR
jgi:hypothetical protein